MMMVTAMFSEKRICSTWGQAVMKRWRSNTRNNSSSSSHSTNQRHQRWIIIKRNAWWKKFFFSSLIFIFDFPVVLFCPSTFILFRSVPLSFALVSFPILWMMMPYGRMSISKRRVCAAVAYNINICEFYRKINGKVFENIAVTFILWIFWSFRCDFRLFGTDFVWSLKCDGDWPFVYVSCVSCLRALHTWRWS